MGKLKAGEKSVGCALLENLLRTLRKSHFRPAPAICLSEINPPNFWSGLLKKRRKTVRERERIKCKQCQGRGETEFFKIFT